MLDSQNSCSIAVLGTMARTFNTYYNPLERKRLDSFIDIVRSNHDDVQCAYCPMKGISTNDYDCAISHKMVLLSFQQPTFQKSTWNQLGIYLQMPCHT